MVGLKLKRLFNIGAGQVELARLEVGNPPLPVSVGGLRINRDGNTQAQNVGLMTEGRYLRVFYDDVCKLGIEYTRLSKVGCSAVMILFLLKSEAPRCE